LNFSLAEKHECAAEMKITKLYAFHFTSGPDGGTFAGALLRKKEQNNWRPFPIVPKEL